MADLPPVLEARGFELVGHTDLAGKGDGMQVMRNGDVVYVAHMGDFGVGTSVVDVSDLRRPRVVTQIAAPPRSHAHKTQYAERLLLVNNERYPYDASDPEITGIVVHDLSRAESSRPCGLQHVAGSPVHRHRWGAGRFVDAA